MNRITFFTRPDCQLCDAALFVIRKVAASQGGVELRVVDIDQPGDRRWADEYNEHVPVVHLNGREIFRHRVDETVLRRLLRGALHPGLPD
ncbi:MAG: glutaredoxin family protein [Phycisphaerae bacterium]